MVQVGCKKLEHELDEPTKNINFIHIFKTAFYQFHLHFIAQMFINNGIQAFEWFYRDL